jgi:predicted thioesterase
MNITIGIKGNQTKIVEKKYTAAQIGSGLADVFATPAMIALMEQTAYKSIEDVLPEEYSSVGIEINVKHLKASLPGAIITCNSEITEIDGKKVSFEIKASDENGIIGTAHHVRYIINSEEFINKLKQK